MNESAMEAVFSSESDEWGTPDFLFDWCSAVWGPFELDPASTVLNTKCERYLTREEDGLTKPWLDDSGKRLRVWCNPPYSEVERWVQRAVMHSRLGGQSLFLLPSRTDVRWFHDWVMKEASEVVFIKGRVHFIGGDHGAPFPSMLAWFAGKRLAGPSVATADLKNLPRAKRCPVQSLILK